MTLCLALGLCGAACNSDDAASESSDDLYQGAAPLWQERTIVYCFQEPVLAKMPADVRAVVKTQADLETRWYRRVWDSSARST